jgi:tetratricopeptide (TPR) repeat protein
MVLFASFLHSFLEYNYHVFGMLLINAAALAIVSGRLWHPVAAAELNLGAATKGLCLLFLGCLTAYSGSTYAATALGDCGSDAFRTGRMREAHRYYDRAAATDPWRAIYPDSSSAAQYRRYEKNEGREFLFGAIEDEKEAARRNPLDYRYPARLGFLFSKAVDYFPPPARKEILESSLRSYDRAIALNPHSADLRYLKALLLKMAGHPGEARELIEAALRDEPRYVKGWILLADLLENEDQTKSLAAYETALSVNARYRNEAYESYEKEFVELDGKMVEKRVQVLRSKLGK